MLEEAGRAAQPSHIDIETENLGLYNDVYSSRTGNRRGCARHTKQPLG